MDILFTYVRITIRSSLYQGLVLRSALIYATRLKKRRERYQGGIKALADQMNAIITSQGTAAGAAGRPGHGDIAMKAMGSGVSNRGFTEDDAGTTGYNDTSIVH